MIGTVLGKCRIDALIGSGAMGAVYRAQHLTLGVPVALKIIHPLLAEDQSLRDRFVREAQLMARLTHPNVVRVFDVGSEGEHHYIVMEYLEGKTLAKFVDQKAPLDLKTFLHIFYPLSVGLSAAHDAGIVHRDMKPENVVLTSGLKPVITDFGIAAPLHAPGEDPGEDNQPPYVIGTPAYIAPEQAEGRQGIDGRADVFSLGMMMFEALTGRLPQNVGDARTQIQRRAEKDMPPVRAVNPEVIESIARVVDRALVRDPDRRWRSATDLAHSLRDALASIVIKPRVDRPSGWKDPSGSRFERRLILPRVAAKPIADAVDVRFSDMHALLAAVERSSTGFGVMALHYEDCTDLLLFADGRAKAAHRWSPEGQREVSLDDVFPRNAEADRGLIDSFAVSEVYYRVLATTLRGPPTIHGMLSEFTDLPGLLRHLVREKRIGVLQVEHGGRLGLIEIDQRAPIRLLCDPWLTAPSTDGTEAIKAFAAAVAKEPGARLTFTAYRDDAMSTGELFTDEPALSREQLRSLVAFLNDALARSGRALEKQFGLGTRPVLEKHLRLAAESHPLILEEVGLTEEFALDTTILLPKIDGMARTGQRRLVLSAAEALLEGRLEAIDQILGSSRRKRNKVISELEAAWQEHWSLLTEQDLAGAWSESVSQLSNPQ